MTIVGHHTVAELREWLAALDYQIGKIAEAYGAFGQLWGMINPAVSSDWARDWSDFQRRYGAAREAAMRVMGHAEYMPIPDSAYPVEDEWQAVHRAVKQRDDGPYQKGDLQDLYNRLVDARGGAPIDMSQTPQPRATDIDLDVFNGTGAVIKAGKDAWNALPTPKLSDVVPSTGTKVLIGGGILLGLALVARSVTR